MIPSLSTAVRSSHRIVATTLLALLVFSPVESCFAAEATLAAKYSLQLPEGWKAPIQSKTELDSEGPGKAKLWAGVFETDKPVEEVNADEIIGINSKAGYKVIERGAVKHSSGSKAQLSRFQVGSEGQTIGVAYSLRLTPKEVVMLVVVMPAESVKIAKSDIQAIFNSIKPVAAASGADDSWLTTPAEKPKKDSKLPRDADSETPSKKPDAATDSAATEWPCALPAGVTAAAKKVRLAAPKMIPGTRASISFPRGWTNYKNNPSDNTTFLAQNSPKETMIIAVYGSTHDSVEEYAENYRKSVGFRKGTPCPYRTPDGVLGTALRFETAQQNYVQSHFTFAFPGKAVTDGPDFTLVDCVVYEEMKPEHQALFEACLQTLKLPSASSR